MEPSGFGFLRCVSELSSDLFFFPSVALLTLPLPVIVELWHLFPSHESEPFTEGFTFKHLAKEIWSDRFLLFDHGISDSSRPIGLRKKGVSVPFILWS